MQNSVVLYFCVFVLLHFCQSRCETCCQQKIAPVQKFSTSAKFLRHIHPSPAKVSVNSSSTAVKLHVDCFKCQSNAMVMMMMIKGGGCQRSKITSIQRFTSSKK